jgi:hypothetical protein
VPRVAQPDQIDIIMADLADFTGREIVALSLNVDANLRSQPPVGTPVDTGWARANWMPSIGQPVELEDKKDPTVADVVARAAQQNEGREQLLAYKLADGPVFNTNSVGYIVPLNEGHSRQSPPGFVQAALEKAVQETEIGARSRRRPNA